MYGKPGIVYTGAHKHTSEIIKVSFIIGTVSPFNSLYEPQQGKLITLSDIDDIYIWEIDSSDANHPCLRNIGRLPAVSSAMEPKHLEEDTEVAIEDISHVTAMTVSSSGTSIFIGTDNGSVASIRRNTHVKRGVAQEESTMWILPTHDGTITPHRVSLRFGCIVIYTA